MENGRPTRRAARVRAACLRCQKRKIRCDGAVPVCGACRKAGTSCKDGPGNGTVAGSSVRDYIASLQRRVQWLESTLASRCPDVDLLEAPALVGGPSVDSAEQFESPQDQGTGGDRYDTLQDVVSDEAYDQRAPAPSASHQIGLVALTPGVDSKYIGPSSGFFFARLVLAAVRRQGQQVTPADQDEHKQLSSVLTRDAFELSALPSLPQKDQAIRLSTLYFDTLHRQYPFLHRATHMKRIETVYASEQPEHLDLFQVKMVSAVAATDLSRRFRGVSSEGFATSAMKDFDKFCTQDSLEGVQCLLLLLLYTLHNPSLGFNAWHINYQCLAAVLDLGLQRDIKATTPASRLKQELRTRAFWCIYTFDRTLATIMGRPIGLRDEGCDLRLPLDVNDDAFETDNLTSRPDGDKVTDISYAVHYFKLAQLNSEVKYILHSVSGDLPAFTYPSIPDLGAWQQDLLMRLDHWVASIPPDDPHLATYCKIRYHGMRMTTLRPTPRLSRPTQASLELCLQSSVESLALYDSLYRSDGLQYTWMSVHSAFLTGLTMLYCIWALPGTVKMTKPDVFVSSLKIASNVLSAIGEHWSEAKRCREVLDDLASVTVRRIFEMQSGKGERRQEKQAAERTAAQQAPASMGMSANAALFEHNNSAGQFDYIETTLPNFGDWSTSFFGDMGWTAQLDAASNINVDEIMQDFVFEPWYGSDDMGMGFMNGPGL